MPTFKGVLTATPRGGGGTLVPVPRQVAAKLGLKGMPKVQAVIAGQPYRGSLMPMGDGTYCLGVLKSIQEAAGVKQGDIIWCLSGRPVTSVDDVHRILNAWPIGGALPLGILRGVEKLEVMVVPDEAA